MNLYSVYGRSLRRTIAVLSTTHSQAQGKQNFVGRLARLPNPLLLVLHGRRFQAIAASFELIADLVLALVFYKKAGLFHFCASIGQSDGTMPQPGN